ncbi:MAG: WD40 repeat domain-containing protein [Planctomycetota bacterium]|jgi:WD40 repeat protein
MPKISATSSSASTARTRILTSSALAGSSAAGFASAPRDVAYSCEGDRIVSASFDGTLKIWDTNTGQLALTLHGHEGPVFSVAFTPDGRRIVSGSADMTVKFWRGGIGE